MTALTRRPPPSSRQLLTRILDEGGLVESVRALPPRALARLIEHVGLEDAGELVALATTDQLARVFDEDLWRRGRPGEDEHFDAARFVVWLEVLLEAGATFTATRLAELPEDFVVHALHAHVLVIDLDALALEMGERAEHPDHDVDYLEKALEGCLYQELDRFRVMARRHDGWDAIAAALLALDERHHDLLMRLCERCAYLSARDVEDAGGLYDVLTSEDMLAADVAGDREDRRATEGFVAPSSALAFLRGAAATPVERMREDDRDAVTRAYFRHLAPPAAADLDPAGDRLAALLRDSGVLDDAATTPRHRRLAAGPTPPGEQRLRDAIAALLDDDPALHGQRLAELGYLANVLVAGADPGGGRSFRPAEAAAAAITTCALGLDNLRALEPATTAAALVARAPADRLFRLGWRLLHERTGNPARALLDAQLSGATAGS